MPSGEMPAIEANVDLDGIDAGGEGPLQRLVAVARAVGDGEGRRRQGRAPLWGAALSGT